MSILINIASEFTGKKAFDKAERSTKNLEKSVKSLGKTLGYTLSAAAIGAYSRAAVKAFAADEAAVARLATAVDNLGLSYFKTDVEDFIAKTQQSAGVLDDVLRPAMQALLTTTGSLTKSQKLLNDAITISRASGVELSVVAQDLANGYVGITRGLKKYNTGLTQTELKTKSFADILGVLLTRSAGAADAYLTTTAYKMEVLGVASENAKETIGKGLVDAFALLGGGSTAADAAKTMDSIAKAIAGITTAAGTAIGLIVKLYKGLDRITSLGGLLGADGTLANMSKPKVNTNRQSSPANSWNRTKQQREAEAAAAKRAKELAALQKKQVTAQKALSAEQKKQNALKKAGTVFDLDQIQLIAALKGKLSDEEKTRVLAQLALLAGNVEEAKRLTAEIIAAQDGGKELAKFLAALPDARNPFAYLEDYLKKLAAQAAALSITAPAIVPPSSNAPSDDSGFRLPDTMPGQSGSGAQFGPNTPWAQAGAQSVVVQIDGRAIASALLDQSMSAGQVAYLDRRTGGF
jgi:hypothetical protein